MSLCVERRDPAALGLDIALLAPWLEARGPIAVVDLETTGLPESRSAEILEVGILQLDPGATEIGVVRTLIRPSRPIPSPITRLTGIVDADVATAPRLSEVRSTIRYIDAA